MKLFIYIFIALVFFSTSLDAQVDKRIANLRGFDERKLHFGFLLGINTMDFRVYNNGNSINQEGERLYADVISLQPGLNIGIVTSLRLKPNLNLRFLPGISFGQRDLSYIRYDENGDFIEREEPLKIKSTFLEFPLLIKYNALRMHNAKPYIIGGINARYDLAKNVQDRLLLNSMDMYLEAGAGFDFYMTYFRFSLELKASIGFANMLNPAGTGEERDIPYTEALDALRSRIFCLTFYFE
ncbi:porin family protein [Carboxylicivirga sp. N1Y90]|uniref:type IX secretion/gliding motility protein PorT/SprT n=1 Tax=Carboxylicivirga fragile TaxID=3417571 RepID=UPI003D357272